MILFDGQGSVCVNEAIVAKSNKSVSYNLHMINTIWTFTFESSVIRLKTCVFYIGMD